MNTTPLTHEHSGQPRTGGDLLALGFGTATAMWLVAYVCLMQPGQILGEALFTLTLACLLAGGFVAGRFAGREWRGGTIVGTIAATLNLLVIGSLLMDPDTHRPRPEAMWWVLGNYTVSMALGAIGAAIGGRMRAKGPSQVPCLLRGHDEVRGELAPHAPSPGGRGRGSALRDEGGGNWYGRFAIVVCVTIFLLLITGGLVTGLEAGMAVPDWPRSFGHNMFLFPLAQMKGGVFFEHAHRLYGTLVGLSIIALALMTWSTRSNRTWTWIVAAAVIAIALRGAWIALAREGLNQLIPIIWLGAALGIAASTLLVPTLRRNFLNGLALALILAVSAQGIFGGTRVTENSLVLATIHGVFAQIVFATAVAIAAFLSTTWQSDQPPTPRASARTDRSTTVILLVLLVIQLMLGAFYRHVQAYDGATGAMLAAGLHSHLTFAVLVAGIAIFCGIRALAFYADVPIIHRLGRLLLIALGVQVSLGIAALIAVLTTNDSDTKAVWEVVITTAHQATGALLLAIATLLMLWTRRLLAPPT